MKNIISTLSTIFMMIAYTVNVNAQTLSTINASAGARIIVPMTLSEQNSLNFGTSIKQAGVAGTVVLYTGDSSRDFNGGVSASAIGDPASNAVFNLTGTYDSTYSITMPTTITVVEPGSTTMTIDELKIRFENASEDILINEGNHSISNVLDANGTDSFRLGGKLNIGSDQVAGVYSGSYMVTVDYN
jgi:hypothetical protein